MLQTIVMKYMHVYTGQRSTTIMQKLFLITSDKSKLRYWQSVWSGFECEYILCSLIPRPDSAERGLGMRLLLAVSVVWF